MAEAFNLLRLGKADVIVSGGAESAICATGVGGFNAMKALSTRNDDPEHASRPSSASRDGFIMAEAPVVWCSRLWSMPRRVVPRSMLR